MSNATALIVASRACYCAPFLASGGAAARAAPPLAPLAIERRIALPPRRWRSSPCASFCHRGSSAPGAWKGLGLPPANWYPALRVFGSMKECMLLRATLRDHITLHTCGLALTTLAVTKWTPENHTPPPLCGHHQLSEFILSKTSGKAPTALYFFLTSR